LSEADYHWMGQRIRALAETHCNGAVISMLEGGYNLDVLGACVVQYLRAFS
jgi:acetoin utilization deacetylase AcuC-like enzyme